jgi:predicted nucleotidyltransferase
MENRAILDAVTARFTTRLEFSLLHALQVVTRVGSHAHGTYIAPEDPAGIDDIDIVSVVVPPPAWQIGLHSFSTVQFWEGALDVTVYPLGHLVSLLLKSNPNVLALLWLDPRHHVATTPAWDALVRERERFSSRVAYPAFVGYSRSQLKRMTNLATEGYMGQKRKALVERWGYDCKSAAHLLRLLRMGIEFLETGKLQVDRTGLDADELRALKSGAWPIERVHGESEALFARAEEALARSPLPERPDASWAEEFLVRTTLAHWRERGWSERDPEL